MNYKIDDAYTWIPARISPEVYDKIDAIARDIRVRRHEVVSAAVKAGLSISPYQVALDKVLSDKRNRPSNQDLTENCSVRLGDPA